MIRSLFRSLVFCSVAMICGAGWAGETPPVIDAINQQVEEHIENAQLSGAVTLVAHKGTIKHLGSVGLADQDDKTPMKSDTLFAIASMTKPITATALMILVEEGKVALDDPITKYIPDFKNAKVKGEDSPKRAITVRDVLTHTSGLAGDQRVRTSLEKNSAVLIERPLAFHPGEKWQYSPGLNVAGRVIEIASGKSYAEFLTERIFKPLNMTNTTFAPSTAQREKLATLYKPGKEKGTLVVGEHWLTDLEDETRTANPSGGLFSTATDLFRFYQMVLNKGELDGTRIVSRKSVAEMTMLQTGDLKTGFTPGCGWGLGWCLVQEPQGVTQALSPGSYGHGGAFGTQGWVDPEKQMIFVLLIQRTQFGNSDGAKLRGQFQTTAVQSVFANPDK